MPSAVPVYSTLFQCLYDQQVAPTARLPAYSVFRAVDSRDVLQRPTPRPRIHDFAIIWDDDHDTRIIPVLEEMLMAGLLPGVQFIGEHKGVMTVILAAATFYSIEIEAYKKKLVELAAASGDCWAVQVGMFDHRPGNLAHLHQCEFREIVGHLDGDIAFLFSIDAAWSLGTKEWQSIDLPRPMPPSRKLWTDQERYFVERSPSGSSIPRWL